MPTPHIIIVRTLAAFIMFAATQTSFAQRIVIHPKHDYVDGSHILPLKGALRHHVERGALRGAVLNHVDVYATGRGRVRLDINGGRRDRVSIGRNKSNRRLRLNNRGLSNGAWELVWSGNIKIRKLVVDIGFPQRSPAHTTPYYWGDGWTLQPYCNCRTGKRCDVRQGRKRQVGQCFYTCPNGCKYEGSTQSGYNPGYIRYRQNGSFSN